MSEYCLIRAVDFFDTIPQCYLPQAKLSVEPSIERLNLHLIGFKFCRKLCSCEQSVHILVAWIISAESFTYRSLSPGSSFCDSRPNVNYVSLHWKAPRKKPGYMHSFFWANLYFSPAGCCFEPVNFLPDFLLLIWVTFLSLTSLVSFLYCTYAWLLFFFLYCSIVCHNE